jgi:hypothetical protein
MHTPLITVVAVDYDGWVKRLGAKKGMKSLEAQTMQDFEVLFFHDGPRTRDVKADLDLTHTKMDIRYISTHQRFNLWGHPQRHLGVQMARGDYIFHFNCDNYLEPNAFEIIRDAITPDRPPAIVCSIRWDGKYFPGIPVKPWNIDCMQMIAKKEVWDAIGGWYRYEPDSDGYIYEEIARRYPIKHVDTIIGDNYVTTGGSGTPE